MQRGHKKEKQKGKRKKRVLKKVSPAGSEQQVYRVVEVSVSDVSLSPVRDGVVEVPASGVSPVRDDAYVNDSDTTVKEYDVPRPTPFRNDTVREIGAHPNWNALDSASETSADLFADSSESEAPPDTPASEGSPTTTLKDVADCAPLDTTPSVRVPQTTGDGPPTTATTIVSDCSPEDTPAKIPAESTPASVSLSSGSNTSAISAKAALTPVSKRPPRNRSAVKRQLNRDMEQTRVKQHELVLGRSKVGCPWFYCAN